MAPKQLGKYQIIAIFCLILLFNYILFITTTSNIIKIYGTESTCSKEYTTKVENQKSSQSEKIKACPLISPYLKTQVEIIQTPIPMPELENHLNWVQPGGQWKPKDCAPSQKIAIISAYRDRAEHLLLFLLNLHPFLKRQQRDYRIFVVEQNGTEPFNRGTLMNIGFVEAQKFDNYDCYIFHDVDMVPEDDRNLYACGDMPKHMAVSISDRAYLLLYEEYFGGVEAFTKEHYEIVNGYCNCYWGWGSEDDDLFHRVFYHNLTISRYFKDITRYTMFSHVKNRRLFSKKKVFDQRQQYYMTNGLNNLLYNLIDTEENLLYTRLLVDIGKMVTPPD